MSSSAIIDILAIEEVARLIFDRLDFRTVVQFTLASKQSRQEAATKFVTLIDLWNSTQIPVDIALKSVNYLTLDVPSPSLSRITALRMPKPIFSHSADRVISRSIHALHYALPVLGQLTSLHVLLPAAPWDDPAFAPLINLCTSLKQLHYSGGHSMAIDSFLARSQPKLDAIGLHRPKFAVSFGDMSTTFEAIRKLTHRPKFISLRGVPLKGKSRGWAQGAEVVVMSGGAEQEFDEADFEGAIGVPLNKCWCNNELESDPLEASNWTLPFSARLLCRQGLSNMSAKQTLEFLQRGFTESTHIRIRAEAYRHVLLHGRGDSNLDALFWETEKESLQDGESLIYLMAALRGSDKYPSDFSELTRKFSAYKPQESVLWAMDMMLSCPASQFEFLEMPLSRILVDTFKFSDIDKTLLTGRDQFSSEDGLLDDLESSDDAALTLKVFSSIPMTDDLEPILKRQSPIPLDVLPSIHLSENVIGTLILHPQLVGLTAEQLFARRDVQDFAVAWFTGLIDPKITAQHENIKVSNFILSPQLVSRLSRAGRVYDRSYSIVSRLYFSCVFSSLKDPEWKTLLAEVSNQLSHNDLMWLGGTSLHNSDRFFIFNLLDESVVNDKVYEFLNEYWRGHYDPDELYRSDPAVSRRITELIRATAAINHANLHPEFILLDAEFVSPTRLRDMIFFEVKKGEASDAAGITLKALLKINFLPHVESCLPVVLSHLRSALQPHFAQPKLTSYRLLILNIVEYYPTLIKTVVREFPEVVNIRVDDLVPPTMPVSPFRNLWSFFTDTADLPVLNKLAEFCPFDILPKVSPWSPTAVRAAANGDSFHLIVALARTHLLALEATDASIQNLITSIDIIFTRFQKEISTLISPLDGEAANDEVFAKAHCLYMYLTGRDFLRSPYITPKGRQIVSRWAASWENARITLLLGAATKISSFLETELLKTHKEETISTIQLLIQSQLDILGERENWNVFVSTATSYKKTCSTWPDALQVNLLRLLDAACMVGFYKLEQVEKAQILFSASFKDVAPDLFVYFDSQLIWKKLKTLPIKVNSATQAAGAADAPSKK